MKTLILFIIAFFLFSCSPQKRLQRIVNKNPHLIETTLKDTTVFFSTKSVDTIMLMNFKSKTDTFVIKDTKTRIYRHIDSLKVVQEPITDSVTIPTLNQTISTGNNLDFWGKMINRLFLLVVALFIIDKVFKRNGTGT